MVIAHTERVAEELQQRFWKSPRLELAAWLRVAHQREAMVTRIYGLSELQRRIPNAKEGGAAGVVAKAIKGIWAQEEGHTRLLRAVRLADGEAAPEIQEIQGKLEGDVTRAGCSGSLLARLAIAVGALLDQVPGFAKEIDAMSLREFYEFCAELESTASAGYKRMIALSRTQVGVGVDDNPIFQLPYELTRILLEEHYHAVIFDHIVRWLDQGGQAFQSLRPEDCVAELHALANQQLNLDMARNTFLEACEVFNGTVRDPVSGSPEPFVPKVGDVPVPARKDMWISHGGLDSLFAEYDLAIPVTSSVP